MRTHSDKSREHHSATASTTLPRAVTFLIGHSAAGALIGAVMAALLFAADVAGLRTLISLRAEPAVPLVMLIVVFATLFGSLAAASAVMLLPYDDD